MPLPIESNPIRNPKNILKKTETERDWELTIDDGEHEMIDLAIDRWEKRRSVQNLERERERNLFGKS